MNRPAWSNEPERGSRLGMRVLVGLLDLVGYNVVYLFLVPVVAYFWLTGSKSRRASHAYFERLYACHPEAAGPPGPFKTFMHHLHFATNILDRAWLWRGRFDKFSIERIGSHHLKEARRRGCMLIGAHMGNFDAMRMLSEKNDAKINIVMYRAHAQKVNDMLNTLNPASNLAVIEMRPGDVNTAFLLKEAVDRGEFVALLADRLPPHGRERFTRAPFLGKDAGFPASAWILASLLECPVFLAMCVRTGKRAYRVSLEKIAEKVVLPRRTREQGIQTYVTHFAEVLEDYCRRYPYQWFNFYDFWSEDGETANHHR